MKIEDLSFCTEVTETETNKIHGGYIEDFSSNLFTIFPGVPLVGFDYNSGFYEIEPIAIEGTDFGI